MVKALQLEGSIFGRLTVVSRAENTAAGSSRWLCSCTCGNTSTVSGGSLRSGTTTSCGCVKIEKASSQGGGSSSAEYRCWEAMVSRCTKTSDVAYVRYGGAGITVYAPWASSFQEFKKYIGPRPTQEHSIDRIDNAMGYKPGNVKWSTRIEQNANRKNTMVVDYEGAKAPLSLLARRQGLPSGVVYARVVNYGWSVEQALTTPVNQRPAVSAPVGDNTAP